MQTYPWIGQIGSNALVTIDLPDSINLISVSLSFVIPRASAAEVRGICSSFHSSFRPKPPLRWLSGGTCCYTRNESPLGRASGAS
ncbi:MAG TPA: hypothetical protein VIH91_01890, partial [Terriglobales bacterium]